MIYSWVHLVPRYSNYINLNYIYSIFKLIINYSNGTLQYSGKVNKCDMMMIAKRIIKKLNSNIHEINHAPAGAAPVTGNRVSVQYLYIFYNIFLHTQHVRITIGKISIYYII